MRLAKNVFTASASAGRLKGLGSIPSAPARRACLGLLGEGAEHEHRGLRGRRVRPDPAAGLDAVDARHHDVEDDQVGDGRPSAIATAASPSETVDIS